jgi:alkylated DNA repair dioxygenase AlkB
MFRSKWTDAGNSAVALRVAAEIKKLGLPESGTDAHVLDLHAQGAILPHLDSLEYVGPYIAGISLLSPAIMRLTAADGEPSTIDILLEPGSLYILQCATGFACLDCS